MAIRNICGFEAGDTLESVNQGGTYSVQSTTVKSGSYALRVNPTTTAVGYNQFNTHASNGSFIGFDDADSYVSFHFRVDTLPGANNEEIAFFRDSGTARKFSVRITSAGFLSAYDSANALLATGSTGLSLSTWYWIDIRSGTGASGNWEVRINGVSEISGTGNLGTNNNVNVRIGKPTNSNGQTVDYYFDNLIIDNVAYQAEGDITTLAVDSDGNYTAFTIGAGTGADWEQVDETPSDGNTTYLLSTTTIGEASTFGFAAATGSVTGNIKAVKAMLAVKRDGATNGALIMRIRSGSTDDDLLSAFTTGTAYEPMARIMETDPTDSNPWTAAKLDSFEAGALNSNVTNLSRLTNVRLASVFTTPLTLKTLPLLGAGS